MVILLPQPSRRRARRRSFTRGPYSRDRYSLRSEYPEYRVSILSACAACTCARLLSADRIDENERQASNAVSRDNSSGRSRAHAGVLKVSNISAARGPFPFQARLATDCENAWADLSVSAEQGAQFERSDISRRRASRYRDFRERDRERERERERERLAESERNCRDVNLRASRPLIRLFSLFVGPSERLIAIMAFIPRAVIRSQREPVENKISRQTSRAQTH